MPDKLRWGILGTGSIANRVLKAMPQSEHTEVLAVGSRSKDKAEALSKQYDIFRAYGSYEEVLADKDVDLVYVALPNHLHKEWTLKSVAAGKNTLCEKPFGMNAAEAEEMIADERAALALATQVTELISRGAA